VTEARSSSAGKRWLARPNLDSVVGHDHRVASRAAYGLVRRRSPRFAVPRKPLCNKPLPVSTLPRIWIKRTGSVGSEIRISQLHPFFYNMWCLQPRLRLHIEGCSRRDHGLVQGLERNWRIESPGSKWGSRLRSTNRGEVVSGRAGRARPSSSVASAALPTRLHPPVLVPATQ